MPKRIPLPTQLTKSPFDVREALRLGVTPDRLRSPELDKPFRGTRSVGIDLTVVENRCLAYATRMRDHSMFSHTTAAVLWGLPLPLGVGSATLHVSVVAPERTPRMTGIVGHTRRMTLNPVLLRGLVVASPADTWADLAESLALHDLIAAGEHIITGNPIRKRAPLASFADLQHAADRRAGSPGARARTRALASMQVGALSRPESLTRLLLVGAGLPHPTVNAAVFDDAGIFVASPDLVWSDYKVALEYEGDDHRSVRRFRSDIARIERLIDHGWLIVKISADDLFDEPRELVARVVRRLASRGWKPGRVRLPQNGVYAR